MNNFEIMVREQAAVITANFEEVKAALETEMQQYTGLQFTEAKIPEARETVASLRKAVKEIESKRKEVKKAHMIPYDEFERQAKELVGIINKAIDPIDQQIKEVEENKRKEKKMAIENYFNLKADGNEYVCLADVWEDKWITNIRTSMKSIQAAIDTYIDNINQNIESIKAFGSDVEDKALEKYLKTKQLSDAIMIIQDHERMKAEIIRQEQERQKAEEEKRRREEEERIRKETEARVRAEEAERKRIAEEAAEKAREEERQYFATEMGRCKPKVDAEPPKPVDFIDELSIEEELPQVNEDLPIDLEPLDVLPGLEEMPQIVQQSNGKEEMVEKITELLVERLNYAYCDNCGTEDSYCDECHRKYQNWKLSEHTARSIAEEIVNTIL